MMESRELVMAVDIGGTQIKTGIIASGGKILSLQRANTPADSAPEDVVQTLFQLQKCLFREADILPENLLGMGISIAAFITADGYITATAHLSHQWIGYNLKSRLELNQKLPYYFALDTPAPTLGEAYYGAGQGVNDFVYITVSTGIGAGIISNRQYWTGGRGWAGGIGHTIIDENSTRVCPGCGNHGCLETFAAKQGILLTAMDMALEHPDSRLAQQARTNPDNLDPKMIYDLAQQGDQAALKVFTLAGHQLGIGLTNLVDIVSPTRVVVGGGIALAGELLLEPARKVILQRAFPPQNRQVELVTAALGDLSGMYGAASMVFNDIRVNP
jgi:glucokinase